MTIKDLRKKLDQEKNPKNAVILGRYFKTGKGEYGEGDVFLGISVPKQRLFAHQYSDLSIRDLALLLNSKIHEHRQVALFILVEKFRRGTREEQKDIYNLYLQNTPHINNWDLVDSSASYIVGQYIFDKKKDVLYKLAGSKNLWERRIAMISTYYFIKNRQFYDTFQLAQLLLFDRHDLIHKAVGWMLREVGKIDQQREEEFLLKTYQKMPRTMLRYALEKFPRDKKLFYMSKSKKS